MPNNPAPAPVVQVEQVVFKYGQRLVLDSLSLRITSGISFGIMGPNGAGKTTLIKLLMGLLKPWAGRVTVLGEHPSTKLSRRIGYMPQLTSLYLELSALENVNFFARMYGLADSVQRREAVEAVTRLVDLWERRKDPILRLSGGMRQRVSLACALVHSPPLLLLDEPTAGLDPELRVAFWEHFRKLSGRGTTLIISSHTMDDAVHCDRLSFMREGRIIAEDSPAGLRAATGRADASLEDAFLHFVRKG